MTTSNNTLAAALNRDNARRECIAISEDGIYPATIPEHPASRCRRDLGAAIGGAAIVGWLELDDRDHLTGGKAIPVYRIPDGVQAARDDAGLPPHHLAAVFPGAGDAGPHPIGIMMWRKGGKAIDGWAAVEVAHIARHPAGAMSSTPPAHRWAGAFRRADNRNHPSDLSRVV